MTYALAGSAICGEIYNAPDLGKCLDISAERSLPEIMLVGWRRLGSDVCARANGVFAMSLQDGDNLLLYCDPSGLGKLYYDTSRPGEVAFSTDLQELASSHAGHCRLARHSLHEYLRFGDIASPQTLFEHLHAVEPGQVLHWSTACTKTTVPRCSETVDKSPRDLGASVNMLDVLLERAISVRVADAVRPAAFLSGGVDSALVCAFAARERPELTAVTVGFEGDEFDETPVAAHIAANLGLRHEVLRFGEEEVLGAFERLAQHADQPFADPTGPVTLLAFEHCRERYDVVLDGTGADASVGAMPPRHLRLAVGWASRLPTELRLAAARWLKRIPPLAGYAPILDFEHPADTMIRWKGFSRAEIEALCGEPVSFEHTTFYRTFARFPRQAHAERYSTLMALTPDDRVAQAMRISGLRVRFPFCDRDTDHFIRQLPPDFRYRPDEPKRILRALLARYVPREIWEAPKHGFNFPLTAFLTAGDYELVRRHLLGSNVWRRTALLSPEGVQRYGHQFIAGDRRLTFRVWALAVLGAWLEHHEHLLA